MSEEPQNIDRQSLNQTQPRPLPQLQPRPLIESQPKPELLASMQSNPAQLGELGDLVESSMTAALQPDVTAINDKPVTPMIIEQPVDELQMQTQIKDSPIDSDKTIEIENLMTQPTVQPDLTETISESPSPAEPVISGPAGYATQPQFESQTQPDTQPASVPQTQAIFGGQATGQSVATPAKSSKNMVVIGVIIVGALVLIGGGVALAYSGGLFK